MSAHKRINVLFKKIDFTIKEILMAQIGTCLCSIRFFFCGGRGLNPGPCIYCVRFIYIVNISILKKMNNNCIHINIFLNNDYFKKKFKLSLKNCICGVYHSNFLFPRYEYKTILNA